MKQEKKSFSEKQLVIFKIGADAFGVNIDDVREIIKVDSLTHVPDTPKYVKGIINLREKIVVVVDLAEKLGITSTDNKDKRIIITEFDSGTIGFIVDSCNEVIRLSNEHIEKAPDMILKKISSKYLEGVGVLNDRLLILINLEAVVNEEDLSLMNETKNVKSSA